MSDDNQLKLSQVLSTIYLIPDGFIEEWDKNVMHLWVCARNHDQRIPDNVLDFMRDLLQAKIRPWS